MTENKFKAKGFLVWGICTLFFLYEFLLRTVMGTYQPPMMEDLGLSSFQFTLLSSTIFLFIYGLMQIPVGLIVDSIGLKKSLLIGAVCCSFSSIGFAYAYSYPIAVAYRMLMGFGASFGFVCMLISIREWMPHKYIAIFIGLSQFIGTLGPMLAAGPLDTMSKSGDVKWRFVFLCLGFFGFLLTIFIFLFVENNQQKAGKYIVLKKPEKIFNSLLRLLSKSQPWWIALFSATIYFTTEYLSENEGRIFLSLKGISINSASYMITIAWIGYAIGCPLLGFLSDMFERRKIVMQFAAALALISIMMIIHLENTQYIKISFFLLGLSASGQSIGFALVAEQFKKQFVAVGFGLNNAIISVVSSVNAPLIGMFLDHNKNGDCVSLNDYIFVFNILIIMAVIALIITILFIKETYCKSSVDFTILKR